VSGVQCATIKAETPTMYSISQLGAKWHGEGGTLYVRTCTDGLAGCCNHVATLYCLSRVCEIGEEVSAMQDYAIQMEQTMTQEGETKEKLLMCG